LSPILFQKWFKPAWVVVELYLFKRICQWLDPEVARDTFELVACFLDRSNVALSTCLDECRLLFMRLIDKVIDKFFYQVYR